ncbi:large ribosomal subunit protein mL52-like isoform X1 [Daphnia carinata]|uniref:large ribosomal subunit protein mL52-like isoform X1 n=2 Tax=Daphnia carinata TaxID=120202 RepID=UPI002868A870|nr:large ribosomal subunit protein mL52-like isoform X1 [Daphnia carinata]
MVSRDTGGRLIKLLLYTMALPTISRLGFELTRIGQNGSRSFVTSSCCLVEQDWRYKNGLPRNPNAYGPLTDGRDFTFVDQRVTPIGAGQLKRLEKHRIYAEKILQTVKEMNFAIERRANLQKQSVEKRKEILESKLKPKGHLLLSERK